MTHRRLKMGRGKVVTGASFWNREAEMRLFIERLDEGAHQLLVAQRRMGKTSLMAEDANRLKDRYVCLFADLQKCCSEPDAVVELSLQVHSHASLWEKVKRVFGNVMDKVESVYRQNMLGVRGHLELVHYEERLEQVLDRETCAFSLDMLTEAAVTGRLSGEALIAFRKEYTVEGRDANDVQKDILWVLEHDGYLKKGRDGYLFVSKLLRDWWKNRHEHFYAPVRERGERR